MDPIQTIGKKLTGNEQRDAIHIAILPCVAGEDLYAGDHVGFAYNSNNMIIGKSIADSIGIVDPFLRSPNANDFDNSVVRKGERAWVFLHPNSVTGMRHHWEHPVVDALPEQVTEAETWLHRFADEWHFDYDQMINAATGKGDKWITANGVDLHGSSQLGDDHDYFWTCIEALTGKKATAKERSEVAWSCSC